MQSSVQFNSVQSLGHIWLLATPWTAACLASCPSQLLECPQTHVHQVTDAIQSSHLQSSPSPPAFNHSQHQGLFKWVSSLHQGAKVLELHLHHQFFQWIFKSDFLLDGLVGPPCSPRDFQASFPVPQLRRFTTNKASGGDEISVELFQILKDGAVKVLHSMSLSSGHRTGKDQFSFQSQWKAVPKNAQTTAQLHSSHTLIK